MEDEKSEGEIKKEKEKIIERIKTLELPEKESEKLIKFIEHLEEHFSVTPEQLKELNQRESSTLRKTLLILFEIAERRKKIELLEDLAAL